MKLFRIIGAKSCLSKFIIEKLMLLVLSLFVLNSCDIGIDRAEDVTLTVYEQSNTYSGNVILLRDSVSTSAEFSVSINSENPFIGSFFCKSDGSVWLFNGSRIGNTATINGSINSYYSGTFQGEIEFLNSSNITLSLEGIDNFSEFTISGNLEKIVAISLIGNYYVEEEGSITLTYGEESETQPISGTAYIDLMQSNDGTYYFPNAMEPRSGKISGNKLTLSGKFIVPNSSVSVSKNEFHAEVNIDNPYEFTFIGEGYSEGTYNGQGFVVTGQTRGTFKRKFDAAIALLAGDIGSSGENDAYLATLEEYSVRENKYNIITKKFPAKWWIPDFTTQVRDVQNWLNFVYDKFGNTTKIILIGHSTGGNAVCRGDFSKYNVNSKITLDPIDPSKVNPFDLRTMNQRSKTISAKFPNSRFINLLAMQKTPHNGKEEAFFGYHVKDAMDSKLEFEINGANHQTIVIQQTALDYVLNEVNYISPNVPFSNSLMMNKRGFNKSEESIFINGSLIFENF